MLNLFVSRNVYSIGHFSNQNLSRYAERATCLAP